MEGSLPFVAYCDFQPTTTNECILVPENHEMCAVSYVIVFAFHSDLNIDKIVVGRNFGECLPKLGDVSYLKRTKIQQLKDCAIRVSPKERTIKLHLRCFRLN